MRLRSDNGTDVTDSSTSEITSAFDITQLLHHPPLISTWRWWSNLSFDQRNEALLVSPTLEHTDESLVLRNGPSSIAGSNVTEMYRSLQNCQSGSQLSVNSDISKLWQEVESMLRKSALSSLCRDSQGNIFSADRLVSGSRITSPQTQRTC